MRWPCCAASLLICRAGTARRDENTHNSTNVPRCGDAPRIQQPFNISLSCTAALRQPRQQPKRSYFALLYILLGVLISMIDGIIAQPEFQELQRRELKPSQFTLGTGVRRRRTETRSILHVQIWKPLICCMDGLLLCWTRQCWGKVSVTRKTVWDRNPRAVLIVKISKNQLCLIYSNVKKSVYGVLNIFRSPNFPHLLPITCVPHCSKLVVVLCYAFMIN